MELAIIVNAVADTLKRWDSEAPVDQQKFRPGIGPFREAQLVRELSRRISNTGICGRTVNVQTHGTPDMSLTVVMDDSPQERWAMEVKIVRPFGDNGKIAENWSQNLLHPYEGNVSLMGDAIKLMGTNDFDRKGLIAIGYEHSPAEISLDPLLFSFEIVSKSVLNLPLSKRVEFKRDRLIHPVHQVVRCVGWELSQPLT